MSDFAMKLLPMVKKTLRQADDEFDDEIGSYIDTVATDLQDAGILYVFFDTTHPSWSMDSQILQACRWYALSVFGLYNQDMEKYAKAYASLKATLASQQKYTLKGEFSSSYEEGYEAGYTLGNKEGYEAGNTAGFRLGYDSGKTYVRSYLVPLTVDENGEYIPNRPEEGFKSVSVAVPSKVPQVADGTVIELTEEDLEGVSTIRNYAFSNCEHLKTVHIPPSLKKVERYAFSACNALEGIYIRDLFAYCFIEYANNDAQPLMKANNLYLNDVLVTDLDIPRGVVDVRSNAFRKCLSLENVQIGVSVSSIGVAAFGECSNLKSVVLKENSNLSLIGSSAFSDCFSLELIDFSAYTGNTIPVLQSVTAFQRTSPELRIIVPHRLYEEWRAATNWVKYKDNIFSADSIEVREGNLLFDNDNYDDYYPNQRVILDGVDIGKISEIDKSKIYRGKYITIGAGLMRGVYLDEEGSPTVIVTIKPGYNTPICGELNNYYGLRVYESSYPV